MASTYGGKLKRPDVVNEWLLLLIRTTSTGPPAPRDYTLTADNNFYAGHGTLLLTLIFTAFTNLSLVPV